MRFCLNCHRITIGEPLFCNFCAHSFDARLCNARHINPRNAEVCAQCGSRDLSVPAPRLPFWLRPALFLLSLVPGVVLALLLVMVAVALVQEIATNGQLQTQLVILFL